MCKLRTFDVRVSWYTVQRPELCQIIARSVKDAEEIARRLFSNGHDASSTITTIEILDEEKT